MGEIDDLRARLDKLEILSAEQERTIEELNETITGQWRETEALKRRLAKLEAELSEVAAGMPATPVTKPPHY
jgi:SlyX protein